MKAMLLEAIGAPLVLREIPIPNPEPVEILIRIEACAVCRTDLHIIDGELPDAALPIIPGHEIIGVVEEIGKQVKRYKIGDRVGVPWLASTCGQCEYCSSERENLCDDARFTGYHRPGGYAEYTTARADFAFPVDTDRTAVELAPLLCAGLIGYRAWRMARLANRLGIYGFGAAAHIVIQLARAEGQEVYAFTRPGDVEAQQFARERGAVWAGGSGELPPAELDAAILFAPAGELIPLALRQVRKGGTVVCGGIHMSDIPSFPYSLLWGERVLRSVANLCRRDGEEFLPLASRIQIKTDTTTFPLSQANEALYALRHGKLNGAAVLTLS